MARIRTIKPELWSDPDFVECSSNARLLFLAALNFASDYGLLPDKPKQLKMQCFPGDSVDTEGLIDELIDAGFWERRTAPDGANVLVIRTFTRHQRVDKPNPGRWGNPSDWDACTGVIPGPFVERSQNDRGSFTPGMEGKGMEGKGSSSRPESEVIPSNPVDNKGDEDAMAEVIERIVATRCAKARPDNPQAYRRKVARNVRDELGQEIARLVAKYPEAPADVIASAAQGDNHSLRHYEAAS